MLSAPLGSARRPSRRLSPELDLTSPPRCPSDPDVVHLDLDSNLDSDSDPGSDPRAGPGCSFPSIGLDGIYH